MMTLKADCKKFAPNIFNKSKCQHCFKTKESHTAEALESNRASRNVSKCGYLFVAPDFDFSVSINRTKRWQRRWFVLYDDGELTYSVDEHPDTVPQAVIDMNKVLEVSDGENVTGNQFSIAITAPDKVHFIKGTSKEERNWWFDVLSRFPSNTIRGRNKRFATIPGGKATITNVSKQNGNNSDIPGDFVRSASTRQRFNTFNSEFLPCHNPDLSWETFQKTETENVFPIKENNTLIFEKKLTSTPIEKDIVINNKLGSSSDWKHVESENLRNILNNSDSTSSPPPGNNDIKVKQSVDVDESPVKDKIPTQFTREIERKRNQTLTTLELQLEKTNLEQQNCSNNQVYYLKSVSKAKTKKPLECFQIESSSPPLHRRRHTSERGMVNQRLVFDNDHQEQPQHDCDSGLQHSVSETNFHSSDWRNQSSNQCDISPLLSQDVGDKTVLPLKICDKEDLQKHRMLGVETQICGDPDGCRLDFQSSYFPVGVPTQSESTPGDLCLKKGWLLRQGLKDWYKQWFVLNNSCLIFYHDPNAEELSIMDGIVDLQLVKGVEELEMNKNHAFCIKTFDNKKYVFAAVTVGVRSNWIQAIRHVVENWDALNVQKKNFAEDVSLRNQHEKSGLISPVRSDEPIKLLDASSSDDPSEYFSVVDDDEGTDRQTSPRTLPPSPPLTRTAISKVKEKARSRSSSSSRLGHQLQSPGLPENEHSVSLTEIDQQSDGGVSDQSNSSFQGGDLSYWERKASAREYINENVENGKKITSNNNDAISDSLIALKNHPDLQISKNEDLIPEKDEVVKLSNGKGTFLVEEYIVETKLEQKSKEQRISKGSSKEISEKFSSKDKQRDRNQKQGENLYKLKYEFLKMKYKKERAEWEDILSKEKLYNPLKPRKMEDLQETLQNCKEQLCNIKCKLEKSTEKKRDVLAFWKEISKLYEDVEKFVGLSERRSKKDNEVSKLKQLISELQGTCDERKEELESLRNEYDSCKNYIKELEHDLIRTRAELKKTTVDKVDLQGVIKQLEKMLRSSLHGSDELSVKEQDSLLLLENLELKTKLETVTDVTRSLKKRLEEAHQSFDDLEINYYKLQQDVKRMQDSHSSQLSLMTARVDDLTTKLTVSERNFRQTKQKLTRSESRQERRKSSLRGKDGLNVSKEFELKLVDLEQKLESLEYSLKNSQKGKEVNEEFVSTSQTHNNKENSEKSSGETQGFLIRLNNLDTKVKNACTFAESLNHENDQIDSLEKPKICIQVKTDSEESGPEEWSTLSLANSITDLHELVTEEGDGEKPQTLSECVYSLFEKVQSLSLWFRNVVYLLHKQEGLDESVNTELKHLVEAVECLSSGASENLQVNQDKGTLLELVYQLTLLQEAVKGVDRLANFEVSEKRDLIEEIGRISHWLLTLEEELSSSTEDISVNGGCTTSNPAVKRTMCVLLQDSVFVLGISGLQKNSSQDNVQQLNSDIITHLKRLEDMWKRVSIVLSRIKTDNLTALFSCLNNSCASEACRLHEQFSVTDLSPTEKIVNEELVLAELCHIVTQICEKICKLLVLQRNQHIGILCHDQEMCKMWCTVIDQSIHQELDMFSSELRTGLPKLPLLSKLDFECLIGKETLTKIVELSYLLALSGTFQGVLTYFKNQKEIIATDKMSKFIQETSGLCDDQWVDQVRTSIYQRAEQAVFGFSSVLPQNACRCLHEANAISLEKLARQNASNLVSLQSHFEEKLSEEASLFQLQLETLQQEPKQQLKQECCACGKLKQEIYQLQVQLEECQDSSEKNSVCHHCEELQNQLRHLKDNQKEELQSLKYEHHNKLEAVRKDTQELFDKQNKLHSEEVSQLQNELQLSQKRLKHLEFEYDEQMKSLIEIYQQKLENKHEMISEESIRRRYQSEIEQWRNLSEKGLVAMENSYKRMIADLEHKHQMEIEQLENEKEKALAEETQATRAALDAMRKAHKEEVQREIVKFKDEFLKQMEHTHSGENLYKDHEAELEEIKQEILSLSEKYSIKCLENASLKESLEVLRTQLENSNFQVFDLLARNKQLRAHLASEVADKKEELLNVKDVEHEAALKQLVHLRDQELAKQKEENAELLQKVHLTENHVNMLDIQCLQLDQSLKAERRLREDEVSSLRTRLESFIVSSSTVSEEDGSECRIRETSLTSRHNPVTNSSTFSRRAFESKPRRSHSLALYSAEELMRSPSFPGQDGIPGKEKWRTLSSDDWKQNRHSEQDRK
ncbi:uncharacterized protein LOC143227331 [Tachypleus tridentatus]|uniref:uncharacterized protein LOC143227331 n=1 Tax=Tachypleus tridentatus TaxID=6853 RepID=UPI003FD01931